MALIKSQILTQASGSVGGLTYSHAKGGMYMRSRAIPVNPQTARQNEVRAAVAMFSQMWLNVLTQTQRDAWDLYGANVTMTNRLGDPINLSGQNQYIRANVAREQANANLGLTTALLPINDAPTNFDLPTILPPLGLGVAVVGDQILFSFDDTANWVNDDQNALFVYQGRPRNASRNYFSGPYRLVGIIQGDGGAPPTSPATVAGWLAVWPGASLQRTKIKFMLSVGISATTPTGQSLAVTKDATII